ncbi:hypothetical protein [Peribacillus sp. TH24]|uniref:hypothetical protein n=1 Tax=Peribacillus sp. TH24 TaxID=2798483 RepID=UPI001912D7AC|nr:hypothetical protein [Peribacillus sp. TH24]MBK5446840.1 hypothetical protein [Peribacillus sp. TH24]
MPKTTCPVCNNQYNYRTKKPDSCSECHPFLKRANDIFNNPARKPVHFIYPLHFAQYLSDMFYSQKELCAYSKMKMFKKNRNKKLPIDKDVYYYLKFSVDRVVSDKNYQPGNIVLCTNIYNVMKNNLKTLELTRLSILLLSNLFENDDTDSVFLINSFVDKINDLNKEEIRKLTQEKINEIVELEKKKMSIEQLMSVLVNICKTKKAGI